MDEKLRKMKDLIYNLYLSIWSVKLILTSLKIKKGISRAIFIVILANREVCFNIDFSNIKTKFPSNIWLHSIDFITKVDEGLDPLLVEYWEVFFWRSKCLTYI